MKEIKAIKAEAPDIRARDRAYQRQVLQRWVQDLRRYNGEEIEREVIQAEATAIRRQGLTVGMITIHSSRTSLSTCKSENWLFTAMELEALLAQVQT